MILTLTQIKQNRFVSEKQWGFSKKDHKNVIINSLKAEKKIFLVLQSWTSEE